MLAAEQLVYTRVEPDFSPRRKSGYQTVYRSAKLSAADVAFIEQRVRSFPGKPPDLVRWQFFLLEDAERVVLTRSQVIDSDREIVDRNERPGPYLAHCLIFGADVFRQLDCDPFTVLDQGDLFLADARTMVDQFGRHFEDAPPASFEPLASVVSTEEDTLDWPREEFAKLLGLAGQAEKLMQQGKTVALLGTADEILATLRTVFSFPDATLRRQCTFDTAVDESTLKPGIFWAIGLARRGTPGKYLEVDAARMKVLAEVGGFDAGGMFGRWVTEALQRDAVPLILKLSPTMRRLADILEGRAVYSPRRDWDPIACRVFYQTFANEVRQELRKRLHAVLGKGVSEPLAAFLEPSLEHGQPPWWLETPLKSAALAQWVTAWISQDQPSLWFTSWRTLAKLARAVECWPLLFWSASLGLLGSSADREHALETMNAEEFETALVLMGHTVPAKEYVHPRHVRPLLQAAATGFLSETEWLALVQAVVERGLACELRPLAGHVARLSRHGLTQLDFLLRQATNLDDQFEQARHRRANLGQPVHPAVSCE